MASDSSTTQANDKAGVGLADVYDGLDRTRRQSVPADAERSGRIAEKKANLPSGRF